MRIGSLPLVLQDLITELAWGKNAHETFLLACIATEVNHWNIPEVFIRMHFFDWRDMRGRQSPLKVFNACLAPAEWFRDDVCYLMLQMLDFRRKKVKIEGSRLMWMRRLRDDWTNIVPFSAFYLRLLCDESNWKACGYRALQSMQFAEHFEQNSLPFLI